jgi:hypothetical protein
MQYLRRQTLMDMVGFGGRSEIGDRDDGGDDGGGQVADRVLHSLARKDTGG